MAINKNHPKYAEYQKKFEDLARQQQEEADLVPYSRGQDGPLEDVFRKYVDKLKALKTEYSYLFTEKNHDGERHPRH